MHDHAGGIAVILLAFALFGICTVVGAANLRRREERYDATLTDQRRPGEGDATTVDPAVWHPSAQTWGESAEPIYSQLAAEVAAVEADGIDEEWSKWGGESA